MEQEFESQLLELLDQNKDEIIKLRRHLHKHPELSFHEKHTSEYIKKYFADLDCEVKSCGSGYGLIVDINSNKAGKKIAWRADFDALPIEEENDLAFKSENPGVMHACGHDGHTAYLMVLGKCLIELKDKIPGSVRLIFQPAEELAPGGALSMIEAGCLDGVDTIFGIHVMSTFPTGSVQFHSGATQTGRANFDLSFEGTGAHASMPQLGNDAIVAGSYFVNAVQTVVSRRVDPYHESSVTISSFDGSSDAYNAIQGKVTMKGDVRMMDEADRSLIRDNIKRIVKGVETTFNMKAKLEYDDNYPVLVNDPVVTGDAEKWIEDSNLPEVKLIKDSGQNTPSEDFAYYAQKVPACFYYVGCQPDDGSINPHHNPHFLLNEDCLIICAKSAASVIAHYFA